MSTATLYNEKKKPMIPQLRFLGFEGEFEYKKLGDACNIIMGQSPDSKSYNENGEGYYLIQGNADIVNRTSCPRQWTNMPTKICEIGDIILTVRAPVGAVAKSLHNACIGRGVCVIRNLVKFDLEYIYQFLLDFETKWGKLEQGSTFTAVSGNDIKSIKNAFPSLPEQKKIASFLSAVDEKIQQLSRKKELLEQYKKGIMQQLFSGKLRFKDENGKNYADWEEKSIGELLSEKIANGETVEKTYFIDDNTYYYLVQLDNLFKSSVELDITNLSQVKLKNSAKKLEINDIIINRVSIKPSGVAKVTIVSNLPKDLKTSFESNMFRVRLKSEEISPIFFSYYSLSRNYIKQKLALAKVTNQASLSQGDICFIIVPVLAIEEQQKIANFLSSIDTKIENTSQQLNQTNSFKKGLLQQLFV